MTSDHYQTIANIKHNELRKEQQTLRASREQLEQTVNRDHVALVKHTLVRPHLGHHLLVLQEPQSIDLCLITFDALLRLKYQRF